MRLTFINLLVCSSPTSMRPNMVIKRQSAKYTAGKVDKFPRLPNYASVTKYLEIIAYAATYIAIEKNTTNIIPRPIW
jgi:hypothetical protein